MTGTNNPPTELITLAVAVGTVSQLMIFTDPASAVSQPSPTPASSDMTANTAPKITSEAAVAAAKALTGAKPRRCSRPRIHTHTMKGRASPAVALTATATAIRVTPQACRPRNERAIPAIIRPTMSISLCTPPIRWMITKGFSAQIHSAAAPLAPTWRATRGAAQINRISPGSMHSRNSMVPATTSFPTSIVTNFATSMKAGPYGAVVVVQMGLTLSSSEFTFAIGPTAYGSKPSRNRAPCAR